MTQRYDVAIAGGAVMGSAVAYFLAADADFDGSIAVVERDPGYEACATTRSWGGIRQQFSTPENVKMSLYGAQFVRRAGELLEVDGERPDLGFKERGYLFLASPAGLPVLERNCAMQRGLGAAVAVLDLAELAERFPWLNLDGLAGAGCGLANEGWFDPSALLHGFRRKARALGVTYVKDEVVSVEVSRGRVTGLGLQAGGRLGCATLVNAAGPQAGALAALAGAALPVTPRKRMTYVFDCRAALPPLPLTIDVSGVAFRPEGAQYLAIVSPPQGQDFERDDFELEYGAFEAIKLTGAWAGHYDYNAFDQNAVLGPHPEIEGLMFCNGFSGHGLQQSPAAGRAVAELIVHGRFRSLDLTKLLYARIAEGRPVQEENIV